MALISDHQPSPRLNPSAFWLDVTIGFCLNTAAASLLRFVSAQAPAANQTALLADKTVLMNIDRNAALFRKVPSFYPTETMQGARG